jgi:hypothetical protein
MHEHFVYFVWKRPAVPGPYRIVHREVKRRTSKGYPITFALKAIPGEYETWEKAQSIADRLNRGEPPAEGPDWTEVEEDID